MTAPTDDAPDERQGSDRLDSWKDIAAYLRRDVSTVQRWERHEGLPVRRHLHRKTASVYAYRSDIDEWWQRRELRIGAVSESRGEDRPDGLPMRTFAVALGLALVVSLLMAYGPYGNTRVTPGAAIDPTAYQEYVVGRYHMAKQNEADIARAIDHFEQATTIEPKYAAAYAALSDAWWARGIWGEQTLGQVESASRAAAQKALVSNPDLVEARASLGRIKYTYDRDWAGAETDFRRALAIDPDNLEAHYFYAMLLMGLGRFPEAITHIERARQLDPSSSMVQSGFGRILYRTRRYEDAIDHLRRATALEPRNYSAFSRLGDVYAAMGRYTEALASYDEARSLGQSDRGHLAKRARVYAGMGRYDEARRMLENLENGPGIPLWEGAEAYAALGDGDGAFDALFRALEERSTLLIFVKEEPAFDSLHSDARWKTLLARLNLDASVDARH